MFERFLSSSALIMTLILVRYAFRKYISARLGYSLWLLVLLRLLLPFSFYPIPVSVTEAAAPTAERIEAISETEIIGDPRPETDPAIIIVPSAIPPKLPLKSDIDNDKPCRYDGHAAEPYPP